MTTRSNKGEINPKIRDGVLTILVIMLFLSHCTMLSSCNNKTTHEHKHEINVSDSDTIYIVTDTSLVNEIRKLNETLELIYQDCELIPYYKK